MIEEKFDHTQAQVFKNKAQVDLKDAMMVDDVDGVFNDRGFEMLHHFRPLEALF